MQGGDPTGTGRGGESIYGYTLSSSALIFQCVTFPDMYLLLCLLVCVFSFPRKNFSL